MNFKKGLAVCSILILGLALIACDSSEKKAKKDRGRLYEQKEFRTFTPDKGGKEAKPSATLGYQSYIEELESSRLRQMNRLDSIHEAYSSADRDQNMGIFRDIFYLKKQGVALKSTIIQIRGLSSYEFNAQRILIKTELEELEKEITKLEKGMN